MEQEKRQQEGRREREKKSTPLGEFLYEARMKSRMSLREVEKESKKMYPDSPERQISNGYLYQIETGQIETPHPLKLKTVAQIYKLNYFHILALAGYLNSEESKSDIDAELVKKFTALTPEQQNSILQIIDTLLNAQK